MLTKQNMHWLDMLMEGCIIRLVCLKGTVPWYIYQ